jgi:hypothetical protein
MQSEVKPRMYKVLIPLPKSNGQGTYWMRVGTAFPSKDGSGALNVLVDALPAAPGPKMMFHVREMDEEDFQRGGEGGKRIDRRNNHQLPAPSAGDENLPF